MAKQQVSVALVVPAYNEATVVGSVVRGLKKAFRKSPYNYEIIVVDDGSSDDTADRAQRAGAHVIRHIINVGSGGATATGLSYAQARGFDVAATLDADGQHDAQDVLRGIKILLANHTDLLIGSRLMQRNGMSKLKTIGNKGLSFITFALFGINVTDSQSGLRIFSRHALENLRWKTSGYEFCSEMLWRARQIKLTIDEYPIKTIYTEYSMSKGQNNWNGFNIVKVLLARRVVEILGE